VTETAVYLKALTPEGKASLGAAILKIDHFPFRVGRECRGLERNAILPSSRRREDSIPNNDLYLVELGTVLNVSREHFQIERVGNTYHLVDRGSSCGTLVEGELLGEKKKRPDRRHLHDQDVIIVGSAESRFVFKFVLVDSH